MNYLKIVKEAHAELRQANITDVHGLRALDHDGYSEYGTHCDEQVKAIQKTLLTNLHETMTDRDPSSSGYWCSCGHLSSSVDQLYKHQANVLRQQLKQLGG